MVLRKSINRFPSILRLRFSFCVSFYCVLSSFRLHHLRFRKKRPRIASQVPTFLSLFALSSLSLPHPLTFAPQYFALSHIQLPLNPFTFVVSLPLSTALSLSSWLGLLSTPRNSYQAPCPAACPCSSAPTSLRSVSYSCFWCCALHRIALARLINGEEGAEAIAEYGAVIDVFL